LFMVKWPSDLLELEQRPIGIRKVAGAEDQNAG